MYRQCRSSVLGQPEDGRRLVRRQPGEVAEQHDLGLERVLAFRVPRGPRGPRARRRRGFQNGARLVQFLAAAARRRARAGLAAPARPGCRAWPGRRRRRSAADPPRSRCCHPRPAGTPRGPVPSAARFVRAAAGPAAPRELVQLGVDQRQEIRRRLPVPGLRRLEHSGHLRVATEGHYRSAERE